MSRLYRIKKKISKYLNHNVKESSTLKTDSRTNDFTDFENSVISQVKDYTMTSAERIVSLIHAVEYIATNNIEGDIIECGVWKGGSIGTCMLTLNKLNKNNTKIWLFDTFEGMNEPTDFDLDINGDLASDRMEIEDEETSRLWAKAELDNVKENISKYNYPSENVNFIKGMVEETLLSHELPEKISLLRLDTDWYESTKIELEILYPKLVSGGVLIIDDYGHWDGCRRAVDEYFNSLPFKPFLGRIDYTGRIMIKP
ncbi:Macrocin O-methyltransferase [Flavobacterium sp. ACN2]|uniref:TylF/MycF/NovP-related O-methyltransferase n=1 Tax=Flavobacterium chungangensis TaxID=2708132 RepID=A0ABV8ZGJ9_9FLAO|nr:TylF/MycF/NovP-related O-methyltransferase [Flavobacterium sp. ACN2]PBI84138.1 Macrocin O-methyltransferase [Flavobacterium sp. ACN2]